MDRERDPSGRAWPLLRQVLRRDLTALGETAYSARTAGLHSRLREAVPVPSVCPYCATGCAQTVWVREGRIAAIEGDPDSPISRGRLCPKGQATFQYVTSDKRLDRVRYRRPGGTAWETLDLDTALDMVVDRVLRTREETWEAADAQGRPLNRTMGMSLLGGATLDNEESYLLRKLLTSLGVVMMDNQARICHSPSPAGLGPTWGRGAATGSLPDLQHADAILIMGSNMAETHVVGFQWVLEAKERGATLMHVDPRFTRTSAHADVYVQLRPGTDVVFLGALINHVLQHERYFREFVVAYTNAATLVSEDFVDTEDLDGLFSGWDPERGEYDPASWQYDHGPAGVPGADDRLPAPGSGMQHDGASTARHDGARTDPSLEDPRCVLQVLKRHFARYTPEMVQETCGVSAEDFTRVAEELVANSGPDRTATICYAVGWTMHGHGPQVIRSAAILQSLLGNIGRPGGGIMALRGHNNVQGTTDVSTLYETLPGYLAMPSVADTTLEAYLERNTAHVGLYGAYPAYLVSALRAWYGEAATPENGFGFDWLPRLTGDASYETTVAAGADGALRGMLVMGMNPVVGAMHGGLQRKALRNLDWLVVRDLDLIETSEFWRSAPEIERGEVRSEDIATEVFVFPAAAHTEKSGSFANTERRLQWHEKAVDPVGDVTTDLWWIHELGRRIKTRLAERADPRDAPVHALVWDYTTPGAAEDPDPESVLLEMNGFHEADGRPVTSSAELRDDGSTRCGLWIYAGAVGADGNRTRSRTPAAADDPLGHDWGWSWPANRHVLYNRCSARPDGTPWSERKRLVWWDAGAGAWTGDDVPDFPLHTPPDHEPGPDAPDAMARLGGTDAFIAKTDGKAWLFAPSGLRDGPLPVHYEPLEGTVRSRLYGQQNNPARTEWRRADNPYHRPFEDPRFPVVLSTNRLTEMYGAGAMSRWLPWLAELQPAPIIEMSREHAGELGVRTGDWVTLVTARAEAAGRALVTARMQPMTVDGRRRHHVAASYHYGRKGLVTGDPLNELFALSGEPNTTIQGSKVASVAVVPGKTASGRNVVTSGPLVPEVPDDPAVRRDLPAVGDHVRGPHGYLGPSDRAFGLAEDET